jgi:hypothetical protein
MMRPYPFQYLRSMRVAAWLGCCWLPALLLALAACSSLLGPQTLVVSQEELTQKLARRFPLDKRLMEVLDVHVEPPVLRLLPQRNRLALDLRLQVRDRLSAQNFSAHLMLDAALQLKTQDQTLRLHEVRVEKLDLQAGGGAGIGGTRAALLQRLGPLIAEGVLEDAVVYAFRPEQVERLSRAGYQPAQVQITDAGLTLTLMPR